MKHSEMKVEDLLRGDVLLTRIRKVHNLRPDLTKEHQNYKVQMELAEYIDNPFRPINPTSIFNEGDSRFVGNLPRRGWGTFEPSKWEEFFGNILSIKDIEKLDFSSTSQNDLKSPEEQKEGIHFISLGILNPYIMYDGNKLDLHVQIVESTAQRNKLQPVKINPSDGQMQTKGGKPIFSTGQITFSKQPSYFILSDQMSEAVKQGRLLLPKAAIQLYNDMIAAEVPSSIKEVITAVNKEPAEVHDPLSN